MGRSRIGWAGSVAAPWCLAVGVLLSITAEAEQEAGPSESVIHRARLLETSDLLHKVGRVFMSPRAVDENGQPLPLVETRFVVGDPADGAEPDEREPNAALKAQSLSFPAVDRSQKGDPFVALRPGFDARRPIAPAATPDIGEAHGSQSSRDAEFDPGHSMSPVRPDATEFAPAANASFDDGATPTIPLDFALNSSSPTSSDGVVVAVELDSAPETTVAPMSTLGGGKPNYAALIDSKDNARQMRCLSEAIYFKSRSEPEAGQAAVAQVVLNRVRSGIYPTTVCSVVYQDRNRPFACQFSFACEGKSLRIEEPGPWAVATRIAQEVASGANYNPLVADAVNYHANYVSPFWVGYLRKVDRIGAHIFYAMRDGVNWAPGALNGHGDRP